MDCIKITAPERAEVAAKCGVVDAYLYQIFTRRKMASAALCVAIERASGGQISRKDLRPTDWQDIWPELVESEQKPPKVPATQAQVATETVAQEVAHA